MIISSEKRKICRARSSKFKITGENQYFLQSQEKGLAAEEKFVLCQSIGRQTMGRECKFIGKISDSYIRKKVRPGLQPSPKDSKATASPPDHMASIRKDIKGHIIKQVQFLTNVRKVIYGKNVWFPIESYLPSQVYREQMSTNTI